MKIRPACIEEGPALSALALRGKASWGYGPEMVAAFTTELTLDQEDLERAFVAESHGAVSGFYGLENGLAGGVELAYLFVEPQLHRRGIGAALLRHATERVSAAGHRSLVIQGDPHAAAFYERMGAVRIGSRPSASIAGRTLPLFEIVSEPGQLGRERDYS